LADIQSLPSEFERRSALYARLQSTDVGTLDILLDEVDELPNPGRYKHILYSRYLQLDPRAALSRLGEEDRDQRVLIPTTVWAAASLDLDAALAFVDTLDGVVRSQSARNILGLDGLTDTQKDEIAKRFALEPYLWRLRATSQARDDPAGAWHAALAMEKKGDRHETLQIVAEVWFETDPPAALSALAPIKDRETDSWQNLLLRRWASQDPDAALEWALAEPRSGRHDPLVAVAGVIARQSPREMLELAETLEPTRRNGVAADVLTVWGRTDPMAALDTAMAMKNAGHLPEMVGVSVVNSWARDDPRAAFEWVRAQPPFSGRSRMLASTLASLGESDPAGALALADELDGVARSPAIERVLAVWGEESPQAAAAWLDAAGDSTPAAVHVVAGRYAKADPEGAFEWLQDQSIDAQRQALPTVVQRVADVSPDSALRLIEGIQDFDAKQNAGFQLISTWIGTDPQAAVRAISRMDDSMGRPLYQFAFQSWSRFDPDGATAFLDQIPTSHRDGAIQGMVQQAAYSDPELAERLFERLKGDEARRGAAVILFHSLSEVDPKRAERYRELSGATERRRINIYR